MNIEITLKELNGKQIPAVTSRQVAGAFGKEHRHVLRDIRETIDKCSESFTAPNFGLSEYTDSTGRSLDGVESDIDDDEKGLHTMQTPGGQQEMSIVSEAGLYSLILRSRKPEAKAFKRWITHEVLPAIRKTGGYGQWNLPRVPKSFPDALRMIADIEEEKQLALEQRDYYKRTKAEIGSRREATSMATASAAIRQRDALADKLGEGKHYKAGEGHPVAAGGVPRVCGHVLAGGPQALAAWAKDGPRPAHQGRQPIRHHQNPPCGSHRGAPAGSQAGPQPAGEVSQGELNRSEFVQT